MYDSNRWGARFVALFVTIGLLAGQVTPASAAVVPWTPEEKTIITAPKKTGLSATAFIDEVCDAVKAAPSGATIRAANYTSSDDDVISCFIAARNNGAHVRYTTWHRDYASNKTVLNKLKAKLNDPTGKSYFKVCSGSCYLNGSSGTQHAKVVTISNVIGKDGKSYKNIVFVSSGNFSNKASSASWNYSTVFVGRDKLYNSTYTFIDRMKNDKKQSVPAAINDGDMTVRFYPGGKDSVYETLQQIKTASVPEGYGIGGKGGKAVVRVVMYYWSGNHARIARELVRIKNLGADVEVAIKKSSTNPNIIALLKKHKIPVYNHQVNGTYSHGKVIVVSAKVGKQNSNITFSGSVNLTSAAFDKNTEIAIEQRGAAYRDRGLRFFDLVSDYGKKI